MNRRRLLATLGRLAIVLAPLGARGTASPTYAQTPPPFQPHREPDSQPVDDDSSSVAPASERPAPTTPSVPPEAAAQAPEFTGTIASTDNNIIGLNVARLRNDRYIEVASDLANANGGDWGYLTAVFTAQERDFGSGEFLLQQLLDRCFENHLHPIIRVATRFNEGSGFWARPEDDDAERWRAFFEKARWPTQQVWIVAGNEPNLGREWGGEVDAAGYAQYLSHFLDVFADSDRFKVANAPMDASNQTDLPIMQDDFEFLAEMDAAVPGIFERLQGWSSNPYRVLHQGDDLRYTHLAYEAELQAIGRDMPVLITEAGHLDTGDDKEIAEFYAEAFHDWMADPRVVAVTPLFWHPDRGVFWMFDFSNDGKMTYISPTYEVIKALPRVAGSPNYVTDRENVARVTPATILSRARDARARTETQPRRADLGAGQDSQLQVANTDGQGARLREQPSRSARSIQVVPDGAMVVAVGPEQDGEGLRWRPVKTADGARGWIAASLLAPRNGDNPAD